MKWQTEIQGQNFTPRGHLGTHAAALVVVLVLRAEHGARVGQAADASCCTTETLCVDTKNSARNLL